MAALRQQKITLAEMHAANVRGLLIYCSDYHCSHWTAISAINCRMTSGFLTLSRASLAKSAAGKALSGLNVFRVRCVPFSFALGRLAVARGGQIFL